jgi:hypothetical protein
LLVGGIDDTHALDKGRGARCIYSPSQILNECFLFLIVFNFDLRRQERAMKSWLHVLSLCSVGRYDTEKWAVDSVGTGMCLLTASSFDQTPVLSSLSMSWMTLSWTSARTCWPCLFFLLEISATILMRKAFFCGLRQKLTRIALVVGDYRLSRRIPLLKNSFNSIIVHTKVSIHDFPSFANGHSSSCA